MTRSPAPSLLARVLLALISAYRATSPWRTPRCRYLPTCSEYAQQAVRTHGGWRGAWLALRRIGRCHPFARGGIDEVPPAHDRAARLSALAVPPLPIDEK